MLVLEAGILLGACVGAESTETDLRVSSRLCSVEDSKNSLRSWKGPTESIISLSADGLRSESDSEADLRPVVSGAGMGRLVLVAESLVKYSFFSGKLIRGLPDPSSAEGAFAASPPSLPEECWGRSGIGERVAGVSGVVRAREDEF